MQKYIEQERDPETNLYLLEPLNDGEVIFDRRLSEPTDMNDSLTRLTECPYWDLWTADDTSRSHPLIVQVVEELGGAASGRCASLEIVEIPDDVEWEIAEYDGYERVAEKHRTWP